MGLSLKPQHLRRYRDVARLLIKYGRADIVRQAGIDHHGLENNGERVNGAARHAPEPRADELAADLERLGPTFVKLGQMLSTRPDLLPPAYLEALSRLQDDVEPFGFEDVQRIVAEELGAKPSRIFAEFQREPIAAASLGQVHRATLRDGRLVAVKVQRPGIREVIAHDLETLGEIAKFLDGHTEVGRKYEFARILAELRKSLLAELDYRQEARNLEAMGENLREFRRIIVPIALQDLTSQRVLTMQYLSGHKITALSPVVLIEHDRACLADDLSRAYLKQILVDGFFHADPHPGNVLLAEDGRLVLLDLGMVARVPPRMQESLVKLLLAISEGRGEDAADVVLEIGEPRRDADDVAFRHRAAEFVARQHNARLEDLNVGRVVLELQSVAADTGIRLPQEFTMIGKALLNLDIVGRTLDPKFNPNESIRRHAGDLLRRRMQQKLSPGNFFNAVLEATEFTQRLPERLNRIMDHAANNDLRLHVDAIDEEQLIQGLQKIANRITVGLVLAALIVGAALLMRVETSFTILGYPGLAMLLFAAAAFGGGLLVFSIVRHDR